MGDRTVVQNPHRSRKTNARWQIGVDQFNKYRGFRQGTYESFEKPAGYPAEAPQTVHLRACDEFFKGFEYLSECVLYAFTLIPARLYGAC